MKKVDSYRIVKAMTYRIVKAMTSGPLLSSRFYLFDEQIVGGQILALEDLWRTPKLDKQIRFCPETRAKEQEIFFDLTFFFYSCLTLVNTLHFIA